jgi:hypothetical protein
MANCVASRDCIKDPIRKECREFCLEFLLRTATTEEETLILGYSPGTANAIFSAYNNFYINSFSDLRQYLSQEQVNEILTKFDRVTQFQLDYFQLNRNERETVIRSIRDLGLDRDSSQEPANSQI